METMFYITGATDEKLPYNSNDDPAPEKELNLAEEEDTDVSDDYEPVEGNPNHIEDEDDLHEIRADDDIGEPDPEDA